MPDSLNVKPTLTVSVAASACVDANIASTAAIVMGRAAPGWLDERGPAARLVGGGRNRHRGRGVARVNEALWFASRSCGQVTLLLLTLAVALGALHTGRAATGRRPRFAVHTLHRNLAVLAVAFVAVHVSTAIIDPYAGIRWMDAVVPFASAYQPFRTGLGAAAADLLLALLVTSAARTRLP